MPKRDPYWTREQAYMEGKRAPTPKPTNRPHPKPPVRACDTDSDCARKNPKMGDGGPQPTTSIVANRNAFNRIFGGKRRK